MQHHAPHQHAAFEGYYNKFTLPSKAQLVLVISRVRNAKRNANAVSFTYVPGDGTEIYQREMFVDKLEMRRVESRKNAFIIDLPGVGFVTWDEKGFTKYNLQHKDFTFEASTTSLVPWLRETDTPEGVFVNLPLPLHWHVQSLASPCDFTMQIPGHDIPCEDASGEAFVHQEKNWAHAFPSAHMWIQARDEERGICGAGGEILGMQAFLFGYRSNDLNFDLRPPYALGILGFGPFMSCKLDWESRTFEINIQSLRRKVIVKASAPKGTFFSLSPPFAEGHRENYLGQSLNATIEVKIYERALFRSWSLIREDSFERAGLEFGAGYYPPAGTVNKFN